VSAKKLYIILTLLGIFFLALTYKMALLADGASPHYHNILVIKLTFALLEIAIWVIASLCVLKFRDYASRIRPSRDGQGLSYISTGLLMLVGYTILLPLASTLVYLSKDTGFLKIAVSINNHLPMLLIALSVIYFLRGSNRLLRLTKARHPSGREQAWFTVGIGIMAALFAVHFYLVEPHLIGNGSIPRFALSRDVLIFTYALPHIIIWGLGVLGCWNLIHYSRFVSGSIYKLLFRKLSRGLLIVFGCTFIAQLIIASAVDLTGFDLEVVIIYLVFLLSIGGFVLIYRGVRQMEKIENTP
jgi:hypothetical protein